MKSRHIALIAEDSLDIRLIETLCDIHNITLIWIHTEMTQPNSRSKELRHLKQVEQMMNEVDGVIFPGNAFDIAPQHYGEKKVHPETQEKLNPAPYNIRFDVEKEMLLIALQRQIPIVAIGAGMQLINVVLGGTLVQHLPDHEETIVHTHPKRVSLVKQTQWEAKFKSDITSGKPNTLYSQHPHPIKIVQKSALGKRYKTHNPKLNLDKVRELSMHHQGCFEENLAEELIPVAWSADGLVEAVEMRDYPSLFVATQFHFEFNLSKVAYGIFKDLSEVERS